MKYPSEIFEKAERVLQDRRLRAEMRQRSHKEVLRANYPEIFSKYQQISCIGAQVGKQLVTTKPEEIESVLEALMINTHTLRVELSELLRAKNLPADYLDIKYYCPQCEDRGIFNNRVCKCKQEILNRLAYELLSNTCKVDDCSFDTFDLSYYTNENQTTMKKLLTSSRRYAERFSHESPNLLFLGAPGLGKTHLSLAIAKEVVDTGNLVIYASAGNMLERLVNISFGQSRDDGYKDMVYGCDLLIMDDLGTEFQTRFTKSEVYSIINTRLIEKRPTIINTNLSIKEMETLYDARIASRLRNEYINNHFSGKDIRYLKRISTKKATTFVRE